MYHSLIFHKILFLHVKITIVGLYYDLYLFPVISCILNPNKCSDFSKLLMKIIRNNKLMAPSTLPPISVAQMGAYIRDSAIIESAPVIVSTSLKHLNQHQLQTL